MAEQEVLEAAADWADRIAELDAAGRRTLIGWLNQSEAHVQAFSRMHMLLGDPALLEVLQAAERASTPPAPAPGPVPLPETVAPRSARNRRPRPVLRRLRGLRVAAVAAGLATAVAVPLLLREPKPSSAPVAAATQFASAVGKREVVRLPDGSTMTLDAASAVQVAFAADARPVTLEKGAARFEVAHDARRPFSVATPRARFTALGTNFSVDALAGEVELHVYRGRVRVDQAGGAPLVLTGGEWLRLGASPTRVQRFDATTDDSWNDYWLNADQMRLDAALERIGRYSAVPIRLADPARGGNRFSGRFRLDTPAQSAALIGALFGMEAQRQGDAIVLRTARPH